MAFVRNLKEIDTEKLSVSELWFSDRTEVYQLGKEIRRSILYLEAR